MAHTLYSYQAHHENLAFYGTSSRSAQYFVVPSGYTVVSQVLIYNRRVGSPGGTYTVSLKTNSGGVPGTSLGSKSVNANDVSTTQQWNSYTLNASVSGNTGYFVETTGVGSNLSNTIYWGVGTTGSGLHYYTSGSWKLNYGSYDNWLLVVYGYGPPASMGGTSTSSVGQTSFYASSSVGSDMGATITSRGFCYSSSTSNPTKSHSVVSSGSGTGNFGATISGLSGNTTYYIRSWATNAAGTSYGSVKTQKTAATAPTGMGSTSTSSVGETSFYASSSVGGDGGSSITSRGFCYSSSTSNPTKSHSKKYVSGTTGSMGFG